MAATCATILILPSGEAGMAHAARVRDAAQHRDGELAAEDDRHHPRRRQVQLHERDERGGDQQLVGQRIHPLAEPGDLPAPPRQIAVEPVGERRDPEDRRAEEFRC